MIEITKNGGKKIGKTWRSFHDDWCILDPPRKYIDF